LRWKQIRIALLAVVLFFSSLVGLLQLRTGGNMLNSMSLLEIAVYYNGGEISSFQYFFDNPLVEDPPGRHLFAGLYSLVSNATSLFGFSFMATPPGSDYESDIGGAGYNTSIYLSYMYSDFGILGAIIVSFLLGALPTYFFFRALCRKTIFDVQLTALFLFTAFITIRNIMPQGQFYWILLLALCLQNVWARRVARRMGHQTARANRVEVPLNSREQQTPGHLQ
jgi:oligosaccharide repeat unit polymerase